MPRHATIPLARALNTWSARPAELAFLPLGVRVTPVLYSTKAGRACEILPGEGNVRLGRHAIDGGLIELGVEHAGTRLAFDYVKPDPFAAVGRWRREAAGEWGLRFWITLCLWADGGETACYSAGDGVATVKVGSRFVALKTLDAPVQVTGHDSVAALAADFEANGYFHLASRAEEGPVIALRFNLEMTAQGRFAVAVADARDLAVAKAGVLLAAPEPAPVLPRQAGRHEGALDAVRDVVAWNTIWDDANARPYTTVSRTWNLGAFAVWYNDQTFAALMAGLFDAELARENMAAALAGATPQGNIACIVTSNDAWVDRSQPPHGAFVAWMLHLRNRDRGLLAAAYPALARNQHWWRRKRDPDGLGLVSCGTSAVGEALYAGTAFGARNETGMDNSATHDEAVYDPATRTLSTVDLGLNCALALDAEMLGHIARELDLPGEAAAFDALADRSRHLVRTQLWDEEREIFANRQRHGGFVRALSPTSFYPLLCGAASPAQAARLVAHLDDPASFGGRFGLPNAARDDPAFADNVYWRGRIWPNVNYFVWLGLRRYGFLDEAGRLAGMSYALFRQSWDERRIAAENYNAVTGEALDQADTDPFYIWGAMLPLMAVGEVTEIDPWTGWSLVNDGGDLHLGPIRSPVGDVTVAVERGVLSLRRGGGVLLETDLHGRLSRLRFDDALFACTIERRGGGTRLRLPSVRPQAVVAARLGTGPAAWRADGAGVALDLPDWAGTVALALHLEP